ncbi:type 1 glutamine amidotransferase [Ligilactobacillus cholophilus]|uniref:type 1 glutamine amidotransferase n=1 Tax=Ligilactobacillus cholophilus TaxID=3050131 RepID=UPI0025B26F36|nr:type 1 glutamine amidotransferase [Ligilactobacillus cholophilus]
MRINILQHTPNEKPGSILNWAHNHNHQTFIYHPYQFGKLPEAKNTDLLIILGGPMSPNDNLPWIKKEIELVQQLIQLDIPILGICYGAQLISKIYGGKITSAPVKEVGWGPIYRKSSIIPGIPSKLNVLHWHGDTFEIPHEGKLLFSSDQVKNQGFIIGHHIVGLQFHFEPLADNVREIVINDSDYIHGSVFNQDANDILQTPIPNENKKIMFKILDYITEH